VIINLDKTLNIDSFEKELRKIGMEFYCSDGVPLSAEEQILFNESIIIVKRILKECLLKQEINIECLMDKWNVKHIYYETDIVDNTIINWVENHKYLIKSDNHESIINVAI